MAADLVIIDKPADAIQQIQTSEEATQLAAGPGSKGEFLASKESTIGSGGGSESDSDTVHPIFMVPSSTALGGICGGRDRRPDP